MRFLCTNDDGILAHGLECLIEAAEPLGDVYVVAPDREQSATSHSLTLHHPLPGSVASVLIILAPVSVWTRRSSVNIH